jgi:TRAP-type C4-dicarboxylate transport system permease small subunit
MGFDKVMHKVFFYWPKEITRVVFVDLIMLLKGISISWKKGGRITVQEAL